MTSIILKRIGICLVVFLFLVLLASFASAKDLKVCVAKVPANCVIKDSEFSTGGGDKIQMILEVGCRVGYGSNGKYTKYIATKMSASGFFGLGRWFTPDRIDFVSWNQNYMEFTCK